MTQPDTVTEDKCHFVTLYARRGLASWRGRSDRPVRRRPAVVPAARHMPNGRAGGLGRCEPYRRPQGGGDGRMRCLE